MSLTQNGELIINSYIGTIQWFFPNRPGKSKTGTFDFIFQTPENPHSSGAWIQKVSLGTLRTMLPLFWKSGKMAIWGQFMCRNGRNHNVSRQTKWLYLNFHIMTCGRPERGTRTFNWRKSRNNVNWMGTQNLNTSKNSNGSGDRKATTTVLQINL